MLLTSWLTLLRSDDPMSTVQRARDSLSHSNPWRHARTAFRSNPFVPPERVKAEHGSHSHRTERRWLTPQRLP